MIGPLGVREPTPKDVLLRPWYRYGVAVAKYEATPASGGITHVPRHQNQSSAGSCVAHGFSYTLEARALEAGHHIQACRHFLYYESRRRRGWQNQDAGTTLGDMALTMAERGVCSEILRPYRSETVNDAPPTECYAEAQRNHVRYGLLNSLDEVRDTLADGIAVPFGFQVWTNFGEAARTGFCPRPSGRVAGGHCQALVAYDDDQEVPGFGRGAMLAAQSWGDEGEWGIRHPVTGTGNFLWFPYELLANRSFAFDYFRLESAWGVE